MDSSMVDETHFCEFCASDNELRLEIQDRGVRAQRCPTCKRKSVRTLSAEDRRVKQIVRALIRINYSEWHYNEHIGGDSLYNLMSKGKVVFDFDKNIDYPLPDEIWCAIEQDLGWYPESEEDITLGGGYWDGGILDAVRGGHSDFVRRLVNNALKNNHFEIESVVRDKLKTLSTYLVQVIPAGSEFFRSRVGVSSRFSPVFNEPGYPTEYKYQAYHSADIDRPPLHLATEGRFNRTRVSVLYLASDANTAVSELRPHPGHLVSTSSFRSTRDLKVANFASFDARDFLSDSKLEQLRDILSIADLLNVPVQPEHRYLYSITQLFSDALRLEGFEGLVFKSSVGEGVNLTCFVADAFTPISGSEAVYEVSSLRYELRNMPVIGEDYDRDKYELDENSPLSTLLHSIAQKK